jgi:hypothetical protein
MKRKQRYAVAYYLDGEDSYNVSRAEADNKAEAEGIILSRLSSYPNARIVKSWRVNMMGERV